MTGQILPTCPVTGCPIWTPHAHSQALVAPVPGSWPLFGSDVTL